MSTTVRSFRGVRARTQAVPSAAPAGPPQAPSPHVVPCCDAMVTHTLEPDDRTLHGVFSRDLAPVLHVDSGDTVVLRTLDAGWHLEPPPAGDRAGWRRVADAGSGHALCGPILVRGAEPGTTLEV